MNKFGMYGVWILVIMVGIAISVTLTLAPMTLITEDDLGKIPRGDGYLDAAAFQVAVSDNSFASQLIKDFKAAPPKDLLQSVRDLPHRTPRSRSIHPKLQQIR